MSAPNDDKTESETGANTATLASTLPPPYQPWKVYPSTQWGELKARYGKDKVKLVHILRHAEGTHNVNRQYKDPINLDARLTAKGRQQCHELLQKVSTLIPPFETGDLCVVTSPLTRCIETALESFPAEWWWEDTGKPPVPLVALETVRETVNYECDRRRTISELANEFETVDFSECPDDIDPLWELYHQELGQDWKIQMESAQLHRVATRAVEGIRYLERRPESQIVLSTHSAFLRCVLSWGHEGGVLRAIPQRLDQRTEKINHKVFDYCDVTVENGAWNRTTATTNQDKIRSFEADMRQDYDNCELRSFCLITNADT